MIQNIRTDEFRELCRRIVDCHECPSLVSSRRRAVPGYGDVPASTMFVGLCPGRNGADLTGIPFTGDPSGRVFQEVMSELGFLVDQHSEKPLIRGAYVTNLVKCCPRDALGRNRAPTEDEIGSCQEFVEAEIKLVSPRNIVTMGRVATERILGRKIADFSEAHLKPISCEYVTVIPSYHPSFVARGAFSRKKYLSSFRKLGSLIH